MKRKHFVLLFLFLSVISFVWFISTARSAENDVDEGKIKEVATNIVENVSDKAKERGSAIAEKIKQKSSDVFQLAEDKAGEMVKDYIISPAKTVTERCIEKMVSAGISVLPKKEIEYILEKTGNTCKCSE